jgi:hypothetical protein
VGPLGADDGHSGTPDGAASAVTLMPARVHHGFVRAARYLAAVFAVMATSGTLQAQTDTSRVMISGIVVDPERRPLEGVESGWSGTAFADSPPGREPFGSTLRGEPSSSSSSAGPDTTPNYSS